MAEAITQERSKTAAPPDDGKAPRRGRGRPARDTMQRPRMSVEEALQRPTISVDELVRLQVMPVSRQLIYDAINAGEIESVRLRGRVLVLCGPLRRRLGIEAA
jgi:hypothetical protein